MDNKSVFIDKSIVCIVWQLPELQRLVIYLVQNITEEFTSTRNLVRETECLVGMQSPWLKRSWDIGLSILHLLEMFKLNYVSFMHPCNFCSFFLLYLQFI